ncbi:DUF6215 domain-containing protein [Streptomyces sp. NPDC001691]|uniref:DUF6215 domain-containing protein n=1 Tax=Streptomyces sp. NPDC001691 TaxID=3364600 RepID=UPI003698BDC1
MAEDLDAPAEGGSPWLQALTAVALVAALCAGVWASGGTSSSSRAAKPATCSHGKPEKTPGKSGQGHVPGARLCEALNRPDLAQLLGTPGQIAKSASGGDGSMNLLGKDITTPSARVEFETYTVTLTATYDRLRVSGSAALLGDGAQQRTVLGRPAVFYADHTISVRFRLDGHDADTGPGVPARTVSVAQDAKDSGGSFEVTLWRADGVVPDDAVLLRVTEQVLPTIPGWTATA